ncbi:proteasome subunit alpha type 5 [Reticulomyxa filosa]|uniref:Proteasome subunit alpha type 5 n=1 Tax=Reticulomyxa filosa TaxID=46433 RepID=X6M8X2_RETFI|nr:proteasome subunit alpha type 5 [Reticulomyxa filosa]|eukprot:ETO09902.1 proteasome subunit alpha type 5 [Reticulomyxa filosa]
MPKVFEIDKRYVVFSFVVRTFFFLGEKGDVGAVYSGLQADGRTLVDFARVQAQVYKIFLFYLLMLIGNYWFTYDEPMPVKSLTRTVADYMMSFAGTDDDDDDDDNGHKKMSRPFGVAILLAGVDENGPSLYVIDPSGTIVKYLAVAVGAGGESAMTVLRERYAKSMSLREAEDLAAEILKQVMEAKIGTDNIEFALVSAESKKWTVYDSKQIQSVIGRMTTSEES